MGSTDLCAMSGDILSPPDARQVTVVCPTSCDVRSGNYGERSHYEKKINLHFDNYSA